MEKETTVKTTLPCKTKNRTRLPMSEFAAIKEILEKIIKIIDTMEKVESSLSENCRKEGLNYRYVLRLLNLAQKLTGGSEEANIKPIKVKTGYEAFYEDAFGRSALTDAGAFMTVPSDMQKRVKKVLSSTNPLGLSEREVKICKYYYIEGFTLEEIGMIENLTRERVRQIKSKGLKKVQTEKGIKLLYEEK
jgi:DNA-directed RNA polymerase sigma subunit (sigma70/sigma32)